MDMNMAMVMCTDMGMDTDTDMDMDTNKDADWLNVKKRKKFYINLGRVSGLSDQISERYLTPLNLFPQGIRSL